nr:MAG TPA: hypothetical protein [Caudoviricetes sp.]
MFPLGLLGLALSAFAGYKYAQSKKNKNTTATTANTTATTDSNSQSKAQNVYNYYTNDSTNGNTLFNGQTQKKRTLFGNE